MSRDFDAWADKWLGRTVEFTLLGKRVRGEVIEAMDTVCAQMFIVVEFHDSGKTCKIGAPYQAFRRLPEATQ